MTPEPLPPPAAAAVTEPRWLSRQRIVHLEIYPCQYDAGRGELIQHLDGPSGPAHRFLERGGRIAHLGQQVGITRRGADVEGVDVQDDILVSSSAPPQGDAGKKAEPPA